MRILQGSAAERMVRRLERRSASLDEVEPLVRRIIRNIRAGGDHQLRRYTTLWDSIDQSHSVRVSQDEITQGWRDTSPEIRKSLRQAATKGRERLARELQQLGIPYWPSQANFLLVRIGPAHREFVAAIRQRGILLRDRSADPGCDGCVRITIGTPAQMDQLIAALREVWAEMKAQLLATV